MSQQEFSFDAEPLEEDVELPQPKATASAGTLERIKKLLRLARDSAASPAEAEQAAARAMELAAAHHVDVAALNLDGSGEPLVSERFVFDGLSVFATTLLSMMRRFFHVEPCIMGRRVMFVGRTTDVAIAGFVWDFLRGACKRCLAAYKEHERAARRKTTPLKTRNFTAGFGWGVWDKLSASRAAAPVLSDSSSALVLAEESARKARLAELVPNTASVKPRAQKLVRSAAGHGFAAGKATEIHTPLGAGERLALE